ncbi:HTH-type transcriptional regulator BetI [Microbacterium oxydans]|uniref:HTH-type transcriptional regulator BetI n=1 Tax=Microbacterium oxydans TaxID=82380 RepID=A0A0F0L508_9MICO|nr:TetR family transcriptional regulator [Microbacterium oxydans]KJL28223.1 HTH-type transcriptional regulator BetI [Microbacterium oxydans]CAH0127385.1 HTH-type transcriptional regulator BetI [Microbacterium oxydans]
MAKNDIRRRAIADAGLRVLAQDGSRGLTHRAVDEAAAVPTGTTSNYFRSRDALIAGLVDRIGERLSPTPEDLEARTNGSTGRELFADYIRDIVRRLTDDREVTLALFELRLESSRRPELAAILGAWQRAGFEGDVAFNAAAGLPGGPREIALFHYAIDGLLLDRLTTSIDPDTSTDAVIDDLVAGLLR